MKTIIKFATLLIILQAYACSENHSHSSPDNHDHNSNDSTEEHHEHEEEIHLSPEQMETMNITMGELSKIKINDYVKATGTLGLPPNAMNSLTAQSRGFIRNSRKFVPGNYVYKGNIVAYLENPEFINIQKDYLQGISELKYARQEFERQKALYDSNAGIIKNVQKLEAELNSKIVIVRALEKRLEYIGIDLNKIAAENIQQSVAIYAPMSGYITSISMHNGMYVMPEDELMEIVDESHLHLELDVFEKDISKIREEQEISYTMPALGTEIFKGSVHTIGKEFNRDNKTVRVHGHLEGTRPSFIKDLFLEAKIWLNDKTVSALPEKAVVKDNVFSYIYTTDGKVIDDKIEFEAVRVIPGKTDKGYTEVKLIDSLTMDHQIVVSGAFYVYAQSKVSELRHSH